MFTEEQFGAIRKKCGASQKVGGYFVVADDGKILVAFKGYWGFTQASFIISLVGGFKSHPRHGGGRQNWHIECAKAEEVIQLLDNEHYQATYLQIVELDKLRVEESHRMSAYHNEKAAKEAAKREEEAGNAACYRSAVRKLPIASSVMTALGGAAEFGDRVITKKTVLVTELICGYSDHATNGKYLRLAVQQGKTPVALVDGKVLVIAKELPLKVALISNEAEIHCFAPKEIESQEFIPVDEKRGFTRTTVTVGAECYAYDTRTETLCKLKQGLYVRDSKLHLNAEEQAAENYAAWFMHKGKD